MRRSSLIHAFRKEPIALRTFVGAGAVDRAAEVKRTDRFIACVAFRAVADEQANELLADGTFGLRVGHDLGQKRPDRAGLVLLVPAQKLKQKIDAPHVRLGHIAHRQSEFAMQKCRELVVVREGLVS